MAALRLIDSENEHSGGVFLRVWTAFFRFSFGAESFRRSCQTHQLREDLEPETNGSCLRSSISAPIHSHVAALGYQHVLWAQQQIESSSQVDQLQLDGKTCSELDELTVKQIGFAMLFGRLTLCPYYKE